MHSDGKAIAFAAPVARSSFNKAGVIPNASSTAHDSAQPLGRYLLHRRLMSSCTGNCGFAASAPHRSTYFNGIPDLLPDGRSTASCGSRPPLGLIRATRTRVERLQQARDKASGGYQRPRADTETPAATREPARSERHRAGTRQPHPFRTGPGGALRAVPNDRTPGDQPADQHPVRGCSTPCRCGWPLYKDTTSQVLGVGLRTLAFQRIAATPALAWQVKPVAALRGLHPDDGGNAPNLRCADGQGPGFHR
jgi:hypothetical protein